MVGGPDNDVQVAGRAAMRARVPLAGQAYALSVAGSGLDANFHGLRPAHDAISAAGGAGGDVFTRTVTARARHVEFHTAASLGDLSAAVTLRAHPGRLVVALAVAIGAGVLACDVQPHDASADRR